MNTKELQLLQELLLDQSEAFHDRVKSFDSLPSEQKLVLYRKELAEAESRILELYDNTLGGDIFRLVDSRANLEYIAHYLGRRYYILVRMFDLHCNASEIERIGKQNDRLLSLSNDTYEKTSQVYQHELSSPYKKDNYLEVEGSLYFNAEDENSILSFEDDSFYGSDFKRMIPLIAVIDEELKGNLPIVSCFANEETIEPTNELDDGVSWNEGCLIDVKLNHIVMCYATHVLVTHKGYSLPDFIRMNSFELEVKTDLTFSDQR